MLSLPQIDIIAADVASAILPPGALVATQSQLYDGVDSTDELRVMVVVRDGKLGHVTGEHALDLIYELQEKLKAGGEERFATVEFATDKELAADGGA